MIIRELEKMVTVANSDPILRSKRETVSALLPYAIRLEQDGQWSMADAILRAARATNSLKSLWHRIGPHIVRLLGKSSSPSLHHAIPFIFPQIPWDDGLHDGNKVIGWDAAASTEP
jgi:hypothetical protein